ncbi:MAG: DUF4424 family protein [Terricaulis sp.]
MKFRHAGAALLLGALLSASAALADDSEARLDIGGLTFTQTNQIEMQTEDLFLSVDQVRIRYTFHNRSNHDITSLVAFPLPDISPDYYFEPVAIPATGDPNFVNFQTKVDGHRVEMAVDQRARLHGRDVTARLREAGLPLSPIDPKFADAVKRLTPQQLTALTHDGLVENVSGDPHEAEYRGLWSLATAFHRTQVFPANGTITVEQSYNPIAGGSVESLLLIDSIPRTNADRRRLVRDYCVDDAFESAAHAAAQRIGGPEYVGERTLGYILTTGGHWAGPIGRFHLTIDKGAPENLVSLCAPDIQRTGPTTFELTRMNWRPRSNLQIYFLMPHREN